MTIESFERSEEPSSHLIDRAGGTAVVGRMCGVRSQAVSQWRKSRTPLEHCPAIESATARAVTCEELRPDVSWQRDAEGNVTGYTVLVQQPQDQQKAA